MLRFLGLVLILPLMASCGVQEARLAARQAQSANHLHQLGLATQNFNDTLDNVKPTSYA